MFDVIVQSNLTYEFWCEQGGGYRQFRQVQSLDQ